MIGISISKGWQHTIQGWGWPYWLIDYSDGFVRRGLVGQVFHLAFGRSSDALRGPIEVQHDICLVLLTATAAVLTGRVASRLKGLEKLGFFAFAIWLVVAQVWPSVAFDLGYLDALVLVLATAAALLLRAGRIIAAGVVVLIGPLVHEYFVFLIPFILASGIPDEQFDEIVPLEYPAVSRRTTELLILAALGIMTAALVTFAVSSSATASQLAHMAVSADERKVLSSVTFSQGLLPAFFLMLDLWTKTPGYNLFNVLFFMTPTFISCAGILFWRARLNRSTLLIAAAGLFPMTALLIAWDLSRLLVITNLTSGLLFVLSADARLKRAHWAVQPRSGQAMTVSLTSIAVALAYGCLPLIYAYFPPGALLVRYPNVVAQRPSAMRIIYALKAFWNDNSANRLPLEMGCRLSSSEQTRGDQDKCSWIVHQGETLHVDQFLPHGSYIFEFKLAPTSACSAGRVGLAVSTLGPVPRVIVKAGVPLGGQVTAQLAGKVGDDADEGLRIGVSGLAGDGCAVLQRASIAKLGEKP